MDISGLLEMWTRERAVVTSAPIASLVLVGVGFGLGWLMARQLYEARLSLKDTTIETLRTKLEHGNKDNPALVEGFNAAVERTKKQIAEWRMMVGYANHQAKQPGETRGAIEILEADPRYLSVRRWLSPTTRDALQGKVAPQNGESQAAYALRCVADDIDIFEQQRTLL